MDTKEALRKAYYSPNLSKAGACYYVKDGKRCIVGELLSQNGISDEELIAEGKRAATGFAFNATGVSARPDLLETVGKLGLDTTLLLRVQHAFDCEEDEKVRLLIDLPVLTAE